LRGNTRFCDGHLHEGFLDGSIHVHLVRIAY
jgi:hypothetical protein